MAQLDPEGILDPDDVEVAESLWNDLVDVFHKHHAGTNVNVGVLTLMLKKIFEEAATKDKDAQESVMNGARVLMLAATPMPEKGKEN